MHKVLREGTAFAAFPPQAEAGLRARSILPQHKGWAVTLVMCHYVVLQASVLQPLGSKVGMSSPEGRPLGHLPWVDKPIGMSARAQSFLSLKPHPESSGWAWGTCQSLLTIENT